METDLTTAELIALVRITACIGRGDEARLRQEFSNALQQGTKLVAIREAVLQTYLFAGYAAAINAFIVLNDVVPGAGNPSELETFWQEQSQDLHVWQSRGEQLCRQIYGSQYEKLIHNMKQLHPDLATWILWEGYGKVLCRPFLSPRVRELLIVCITAALGVERQFHSHVRGALNVGASPAQLQSVLGELKSFLPGPTHKIYNDVLNTILAEPSEREP